MEQALNQAISDYMAEVYPDERGRPQIAVFDDVEFKTKTGSNHPATFLPREGLICFRNAPFPTSVAHELEHWVQARGVGVEKYLEQLQDFNTYSEYERAAAAMAYKNRGKLKWWEWVRLEGKVRSIEVEK